MDNQNQNQYPNQPPYQQQQQPYYQPHYVQGPPPPKPNNHLAWAILSTLFCCLPLGIVSIVYASKVDGLYNAGDYVGAYNAASQAQNYALWGTILGLICIPLGICLGGL
jgi:hypothetical protein